MTMSDYSDTGRGDFSKFSNSRARDLESAGKGMVAGHEEPTGAVSTVRFDEACGTSRTFGAPQSITKHHEASPEGGVGFAEALDSLAPHALGVDGPDLSALLG